ncbi:MAG: hypothetical protein ACI4OU_03350 [Candidatus Enterenecus sp.]
MYSQYMDGAFAPLEQERKAPPRPSGPSGSSGGRPPQGAHHPSGDLLGDVTGGLSKVLGGVMKQFSLEDFDTGDILLVLIILLLLLEGDNLEVVITLGLMLLLGFND